ncbi:MAG: hypothetical protein HQL18_04610 [Candidatus Omnitrophica bacterium]|nr:hypothetical protein [Candidatus Omnitrophota bacterium]
MKSKNNDKLKSAVRRQIEDGLDRLKDGKVIVTIEKAKVVQVEFLEKDWSEDIWGISGSGI